MTRNEETTPLDGMKAESSEKGKDRNTRSLLIIMVVLWLFTFTGLLFLAWNAYFKEKEKTLTLAQQIDFACENDGFGSDISKEDRKALCENAQEVIEENDPELQENEIQESEIQEPEIQEPELQGDELQENEEQERENQESERQDAEEQEGEVQDDEIQDPEIQDPEEQEAENQDPEVDDPDPASPYMFTFTFTVPGNGVGQPDQTYTVTCDSGTGDCTVS